MELVGSGTEVTGPDVAAAQDRAASANPGGTPDPAHRAGTGDPAEPAGLAGLAGVFDGLLDDAALFPPGELPLATAMPAHGRHRAAWYAGLVGPFVLPAPRLDELPAVLGEHAVALSLTVPGGPAGLAAAVHRARAMDRVRPVSVEVAFPAGADAGELIGVLGEHLPEDMAGYVEIPWDGRGPSVLAALTGTRYRAKFRTGGVVPEAHPGEPELAEAIVAAVSRDVPFKCTAGLHHAVRHTDGDLERHGFLNVLLAAEAAAGGADVTATAGLLAERSAAEVTRRITGLGRARLDAARRRFTSFGTCSISDPVGDLMALGLVRQPQGER